MKSLLIYNSNRGIADSAGRAEGRGPLERSCGGAATSLNTALVGKT